MLEHPLRLAVGSHQAAANAAYAAYAANYLPAEKMRIAHEIIDEFYRITNLSERTADAVHTEQAIQQMLCVR